MTMTAISLFSGGVDGLGIAFEHAGFTVTHYVEQDTWCCTNLRRLHPDAVVIERDIRNVDASEFPTVDVIFGGPPCQPHSVANNQRAGAADERHLWPDMRRFVAALRPRFVLVENVPGILSNGVLDEICADLESEDYEVWPLVFPACIFGATHIRERVFIVAHTDTFRQPQPSATAARKNTYHSKRYGAVHQRGQGTKFHAPVAGGQAMVNTKSSGLQKQHASRATSQPGHLARRSDLQWRNRTHERRLGGTAHGAAHRLDRLNPARDFPGFTAGQGEFQYPYEPPRTCSAPPGERNPRIAALGNAVVWQQAAPIARAIAQWLAAAWY